MIKLTMFDNVDDLHTLTGIPVITDGTRYRHQGLWDAGFDLDDWTIAFESEERLVRPSENEDDEDGPYPIPEALWLIWKLSNENDFDEVEYNGKWYYILHH